MRFYQQSKFKELGSTTSIGIKGVTMEQLALSLDNLVRLRIAEFRDNHYPIGEQYDAAMEKFRQVYAIMQKNITDGNLNDKDGNRPNLKIKQFGIYLTSLGQNFASVCLSPSPKK